MTKPKTAAERRADDRAEIAADPWTARRGRRKHVRRMMIIEGCAPTVLVLILLAWASTRGGGAFLAVLALVAAWLVWRRRQRAD